MKRKQRKVALTNKLVTKRTTKNLEKITKKLVSKANARLDSLQRRHRSATYASKKLANRLSSDKMKMWQKGKIRMRKNLTNTQLVALNKAINQFLSSATSTNKGIITFKRKQIESIFRQRSDEDIDFTEEDAEDFFDMFGDNDFQYFAEKIGASTLQEIIYDSIKENDSEDDFIYRLNLYIEINDLDIREKAIRLYNKYVL